MEGLAGRIHAHFRDAFGLSDAACDSLVATSRTALGEGLGELSRAVARRDAEAVSHWSHSLKGNLLNAGVGELAALAASIEEMAGEPEGPGVRDALEALKGALKQYLEEA